MNTEIWAIWAGRAAEAAAAAELRRTATAPPAMAAIRLSGGGEASGGIAVLDLRGPLYARSVGFGDSYEELAAVVERLGEQPAVKGVLLRLDSPGGEVANVQVASDAIAALAKKKPVWSLADPMAASAAYWIASQASRLLVSPGGMVGSVGLIVRHMDQTSMAEQMGLKITEVVFGSRKNEFSPFKSIDDEALEHLAAMVAADGEKFVAAVAAGRRMKPEAVRATEGRIFAGAEAVRLGLADGVATFGQAFAGLGAAVRGGAGFAAGAAVGGVARGESEGKTMAKIDLMAAADRFNDKLEEQQKAATRPASERKPARRASGPVRLDLLAAADRFNARMGATEVN